MLIRLYKYFRGYVKIRIEGYSPERFLNLCNVHGILLWCVESRGEGYEMYTGIRDYKKMRPLVKKTRTKILLLEKHGVPFFLHKFRKRKVFFGGIFFCVVLVYGLSLFIWNIHIEGNITQNTQELTDFLETLGVTHGSRKKDIVCEVIETSLRKQYPNMLWVSAEMRGTRILIQIKENEDEDIVSEIAVKDENPSSIVSENDGIVESILVRKGTPMVSAGDAVTKGQILTAGYYEIVNDSGEIIRYEGIDADAQIRILVTETYEDQFCTEFVKKRYTGRKRLGLKMILGECEKECMLSLPFEKYERISQPLEFRITENFYLPISGELLWFYEYEEETGIYSAEELRKLSEQRFCEKYEIILQKGVQIIEKDVKMNVNGTLCHITGTVQLSVPVTKKVPAEIPELENQTSLKGEN